MTIKDINNIDSNLTWFQKLRINRRFVKVAGKVKLQDAKNKENDLELEQTKNENKIKLERLQDDLKEQKTRIEIKTQETKGRLEVKQAENKCKKVESLENKGTILKYFNKFLVITSCITSMLGFGMIESKLELFPLLESIQQKQNLNCIAIGVIFLIVQFCVSVFVSSADDIKKFFNNWVNKPLLLLIAIVYIVSIYSNYGFWISITNSKFVACFYSFIIDALSIVTSYYADKFINLDSKYIYEFLAENTSNVNMQNEQQKHVNDTDKKTSIKTCQTDENKGIYTTDKTGIKQVENENKNVYKKPSVKRTSASKITFNDMQKYINELHENEIIKPSKIHMTGNSNYRNWIEKCNNVEKDNNNNYIKKSSNVISLVKDK